MMNVLALARTQKKRHEYPPGILWISAFVLFPYFVYAACEGARLTG